jgi:hypothetical protein
VRTVARTGLPTEEQWRKFKSTITDMYVTEAKTCEVIASLMKTRFNFEASPEAYVLYLEDWGIPRHPAQDFLRQSSHKLDFDSMFGNHQQAPGAIVQESVTHRQMAPTDEDWEGRKSLIIHQYLHRDSSLKDLRTRMDVVWHFRGTEQMYKNYLRSWKVSKNRERTDEEFQKMKENCLFCTLDFPEKPRKVQRLRQADRSEDYGNLVAVEEDKWEVHRKRIIEAYTSGERPWDLEHVNYYMKSKFGFVESTQWYEEYLRDWGVLKEDHHDDAGSVWEGSDDEDCRDHALEI